MIKSTPQRVGVAIEVLNALLSLYAGSPVTLAELSKVSVSTSYLEQVFALLRRAGLVTGTRGPGGGYAPASTSVTVADVIRAMNPPGFLMSDPILMALGGVLVSDVRQGKSGE
jgi:DNA-binding IscR family transcriptional regulator